MTPPEIKEALTKFHTYLEANGVYVLCHAVYIETGDGGEICATGTEMLTEMLLIAEAHRRGWKVVPR